MIQELFRIGPIAISPFGVMLAAAFFASYFQLLWGFRRLEIGNADDAGGILFAAGVGGIVGAKVYYAALYGDWRLLLDRSGLVWYGGFVLGALAVAWTLRRRHLPLVPTLDAATPALALGYAVGRIGCFLVGDDYGVPTDLPWGVAFPVGLPPSTAYYLRQQFGVSVAPSVPDGQLLRVHPTQLYETLAALAIFFVGRSLLRRGLRPGVTATAMLGLLALERFLVEFLRAKDDRFFGLFTLAQLFSLALLAVTIVAALRLRRSGAAASARAVAAAR